MIHSNQPKRTEGFSWDHGQVVALVVAATLITAGSCLGVIAAVMAVLVV